MTPVHAIRASVKATWQCARTVCPSWLLALIAISAIIPLDPFDDIVPAIPLLWYLWRSPQARTELRGRLAMIWLQGTEV